MSTHIELKILIVILIITIVILCSEYIKKRFNPNTNSNKKNMNLVSIDI